MSFLVVQFLNGLASASSLFLVASGLSIIFGVTRVVNFAHGSFYMLGAYVAWSLVDRLPYGFLGFWGPSTVLTAEIFPTRIRGVANGAVWAVAYFVGFVLWPFATVALQQATGSFALAFNADPPCAIHIV